MKTSVMLAEAVERTVDMQEITLRIPTGSGSGVASASPELSNGMILSRP